MLLGSFKNQRLFSLSLFLLWLGGCGLARVQAQQINLGTQVKGTLAPANGGTGTDTSNSSGCPLLTAGSWTFSNANCGGGTMPSFGTLTGGTNATAAMLVGSGASLGPTGTGTLSANELTGVPLSCASPSASFVPTAVNSSSIVCRQLTQDDILPGFSITSFIGGATVEIGATVTNPTFAAAYSSAPVSASIANSDGVSSPYALTAPFTSATISGSFSKTAAAATTFTLTAISASTRTAQQSLIWAPRTFGGVGTPGATGATVSGSSASLTGATGTLANAGLGSTYVGQAFGPFSPSTQKIYLLLTGSGHTFSVGGFSAPFTSTAVLFVNANGATVPMYLYESTNTLSGSITVTVTN